MSNPDREVKLMIVRERAVCGVLRPPRKKIHVKLDHRVMRRHGVVGINLDLK